MLWIVVILATSMLSSGAAYAEQESSAARRPNDLSVYPFAAFVTEASKRFGVPEQWIRAVIQVESGAKQRARSSKGAMGLMQIVPKTWTELRARYGLGTDPTGMIAFRFRRTVRYSTFQAKKARQPSRRDSPKRWRRSAGA